MATNISGFGGIVTIQAIPSFPAPISITQFADDADPFDIPSLQIADVAMGNNGDLLKWSKANPIKITLQIIPTSIDDDILGVLLENNRVGAGKLFSTNDLITLTCVYPASGKFINLTNGSIIEGAPGTSWASSGRLKTKNYVLAFENKVSS